MAEGAAACGVDRALRRARRCTRGGCCVDASCCVHLLVRSSSVWVPLPVRVRKTSSRLGRCRDSSCTWMPAALTRRTSSGSSESSSTRAVSSPPAALLGLGTGQLAQDRAHVLEPRRVARPHLQPLAADDPLEPVRGVVGDHPAGVDDGDLVGERVGLLEVLRGQQHRRAVADDPAYDVPHLLALGRVEAGRRLVEEDHATAGRPGWRRGRAGGACRRCRSWPAARRRRRGRTTPAARPTGSGRRGAVRLSSSPIITRFCVPVRSSSTEAYCPVRPIWARTAAALLDHVEPGDPRAAAVGLEQGREDPYRRRLAGAVGPQHAEDRALVRRQVDAGQRLGLAETLGEAEWPRSRTSSRTPVVRVLPPRSGPAPGMARTPACHGLTGPVTAPGGTLSIGRPGAVVVRNELDLETHAAGGSRATGRLAGAVTACSSVQPCGGSPYREVVVEGPRPGRGRRRSGRTPTKCT